MIVLQKTDKWLRRLSCCGREGKAQNGHGYCRKSELMETAISVYGDCHSVVGEENRGHGDSHEVEGPTKQLSTFGYRRKVEGAEDR